jgi:hypothetical protein
MVQNLKILSLITHTEIRWLSRGKVLEWFLNLLPQVKEFLLSRNEICLELEQKPWLMKLGFLTDLTVKLKELNLKLQGRNHHVACYLCRKITIDHQDGRQESLLSR